ncbi:MAG: hypothetical protein IPM25_02375 [Chloracidobacterium sp.]|nr:hypothetical protein [Chloracidobacterium sp.]
MVRASFALNEMWALRLYICSVVILFAAVSEIRAQKQVSYCSLFDSANEGRTVISSALMFHSTVSRVDGADTFLYSPDCNGPDYFAIPEGDSKVWKKWNHFFARLPSEKDLVLEIKFEGRSEVATAHLFGSLDGWARAQVILSKIISINDVTETNGIRAKWNAEKPEVERIEEMGNLLDFFFNSLLAPRNIGQPVLDLMSDEFSFVDLTGKVFGKNQYASLDAPWVSSSTGVKEMRSSRKLINKTNDMMKWRATFELLFNGAPSRTYYCDVTLVLRGGDWLIRDAKMLTKH